MVWCSAESWIQEIGYKKIKAISTTKSTKSENAELFAWRFLSKGGVYLRPDTRGNMVIF